jgi:hypothetical protein
MFDKHKTIDMNFTVKVTPSKKDEAKDKSWYDVDITTYNGRIAGRFEHWELRDLIRQIDNAIY